MEALTIMFTLIADFIREWAEIFRSAFKLLQFSFEDDALASPLF